MLKIDILYSYLIPTAYDFWSRIFENWKKIKIWGSQMNMYSRIQRFFKSYRYPPIPSDHVGLY